MPSFTYFEPASLAEALSLLGTYGEEARIIAGGQSLLILMRQGLIRPQGLISLHRIPELQEIKSAEKIIALGGMSTQREISLDDGIRARLPALAEAASRVGSIHVQNLGTVGGNISHAEPNGDSAPALICLGASVLAASRRGERMIPLDDFFRGPFENCLEPDEMVVRIHVPLPVNGASSVYVKHAQRAVDRATVGIGV
jgi:aerobic carbon-monoxide dehydrogenase medium subunit